MARVVHYLFGLVALQVRQPSPVQVSGTRMRCRKQRQAARCRMLLVSRLAAPASGPGAGLQ